MTSTPLLAPAVGPHVHGTTTLRGVERTLLAALVPCVLVALWNTGRQANLALATHGAALAPSLRERVLEAVGIGFAPGQPAACLAHGALYVVPAWLVAVATGLGWEVLFARLRRRARTPGLLALATVFTCLLPPPTPLGHVALGVSFGVVFGKEVFGGTGMGFLPSAALGAAFLSWAFPDALAQDPRWPALAGYAGSDVFARVAAGGVDAARAAGFTGSGAFLGDEPGRMGETSALACLLGAGLLVARGVVPWRTIVAAPVGLALGLLLRHAGGDAASPSLALEVTDHLVLGGIAFGTVFLVADPTTAPLTDAGRVVQGLVAGGMVALLRTAHPSHPDGTLAAVLLAGTIAPVVDHAAIALAARRRARRRG
jgi:Na+-transporting NADH:ubiquinone oxidoreductase subunit B